MHAKVWEPHSSVGACKKLPCEEIIIDTVHNFYTLTIVHKVKPQSFLTASFRDGITLLEDSKASKYWFLEVWQYFPALISQKSFLTQPALGWYICSLQAVQGTLKLLIGRIWWKSPLSFTQLLTTAIVRTSLSLHAGAEHGSFSLETCSFEGAK